MKIDRAYLRAQAKEALRIYFAPLAWSLYGVGHLVDKLFVGYDLSLRSRIAEAAYQRIMSAARRVSPGTIWPDRS